MNKEVPLKKPAYFLMICYHKLIQNLVSAVLLTPHKSVWVVQTGWDKGGMWQAYMGSEIPAGYWWENWRKRYNMEDVCI